MLKITARILVVDANKFKVVRLEHGLFLRSPSFLNNFIRFDENYVGEHLPVIKYAREHGFRVDIMLAVFQ